MKKTLRTSIRSVIMLICLFVAFVTSAGAISTGETIYIVCAICNMLITAYGNYKIIKSNTL